jgi:hypothetical protein
MSGVLPLLSGCTQTREVRHLGGALCRNGWIDPWLTGAIDNGRLYCVRAFQIRVV